MIDYKLKSVMLNEGIDVKERSYSKLLYNNYAEENGLNSIPTFRNDYDNLQDAQKERLFLSKTYEYITEDGEVLDLWEYAEKNNCDIPNIWHEGEKLNNARYHRVKRLKERIKLMLDMGLCTFITLTFRDDVLDKTSEETRRKYVKRYLKGLSPCYVANIDYGGMNGREHYHAIVIGDFTDLNTWSYGFQKNEKIRHTDKDIEKLSKYVSKLTNHAIKDSTKGHKVIYSDVAPPKPIDVDVKRSIDVLDFLLKSEIVSVDDVGEF